MRHQRAVGFVPIFASLFLLCSSAGAQPGVSGSPPPAAPGEPPKDSLGRTTPRGSVLGFLIAARAADNETAAKYLNTRLSGPAAVELARTLYVVLDRRLPVGVGLAQLSDRSEGLLSFRTKPDHNTIGTIKSDGGDVDIIVERVDRGKEGRLWLFSTDTLAAVPRLYRESDAFEVESVIPKFLVDTRIAGISLGQWLTALVGIPMMYLFTVLLNRLFSRVAGLVRRHMRRDENLPDPEFLPLPVRILIVAQIIRSLLSNVAIPILAREFWSSVAGVLTITGFVWMLILLNGVGERLVLQRLDRRGEGLASILRLGRRAIDGLLLFAGILIGLRYFGVNLTAALAGLGVGGIAIALAAQKTLENVIGGISVVFDRVLRVGEHVRVGDTSGFVERIGLRSTSIRTLDRTLVSIPNGQLATVSLENMSIRDKFWLRHTLNLRKETAATMIREVLERTTNLLGQDSRIESESVRVRFLGFGPSSLDIEIVAYVLAANWGAFLETQQDLLLEVMDIVQAAGSWLAYPSQTLYLARSGASAVDTALTDIADQVADSNIPKALQAGQHLK